VPKNLADSLPDAIESTVQGVLKTACAKDLRLATAESCTGGLIASILTDVEGCSHAFERGFVVYTKEAKRDMLGVPEELLQKHGAVSESVAVAMAEQALVRSRADIAVSTTGYAGSGAKDHEEGLVHFACARRGRATKHREEHFGAIGRGPVRLECIKVAMDLFEDALE
jgi:nicotinamide-nucleotide amidase